MGDDVAAKVFSREDRQRYRDKVKRNLDVFARMLRESRFDAEKRSIGLEIELNLVDEDGDPAMANAEVLERIADDAFVTELGQFNIEINIPPRLLEGEVFSELEQQIRDSLNAAEDKAREIGAHMMIVGILPTLGEQHLHARTLSANPRYTLLNEQIFAARGEDLQLSIGGVERLSAYADSIAPEAACTSVQLHQLVHPEDFARHWNAAQAIAGIQLAVGANSPFFFGKELWRETRIALFEQATDTRPEELKAQGVRPRVWFGERWITSIFDLFEENVRYFPALLPLCDDEDPVAVLERGDAPTWPSCGCTTAPSTAGTAPSTRSCAGARTCAWRTACCRPARPSSTSSPTPRSTTASCARWSRTSGRSGRRCRSGRRGQPPRRRPRRDRRARVLARRRRRAGRPSWCCAGCCRSPTRGSSATASTRTRATGCSGSSSGAAWRRPTARRGRAGRSARFTRTRGRPRRGAAPDDGAYRDHMHGNEPVHTWPLG